MLFEYYYLVVLTVTVLVCGIFLVVLRDCQQCLFANVASCRRTPDPIPVHRLRILPALVVLVSPMFTNKLPSSLVADLTPHWKGSGSEDAIGYV